MPYKLVQVFGLLMLSSMAWAASDACLLDELARGGADRSAQEIIDSCNAKTAAKPGAEASVKNRVEQERKARYNPFAITAHKPNFIMPVTYNLGVNPQDVYDYDLQRVETVFQISFKAPIGSSFWQDRIQVYGAYTHQSWWQAFHRDASAPFRETNYEPELFATLATDLDILGFDYSSFGIGFSHQSNGQSGLRSRSWNRIYGTVTLEKAGWVVRVKPWLRLQEDEKDFPLDPKGDDNPDILHYTGHFEASMVRRLENERSIYGMVRYNFKHHKGALKLAYAHPISKRFKGYVEFFDGYAESLIDYDHHNLRIGVGILLTDWL